MPAVSALLHPDEARGYVEAGHELGIHGWIHERNSSCSPADERELAFRSADTLEQLTGVRPVGVRTRRGTSARDAGASSASWGCSTTRR